MRVEIYIKNQELDLYDGVNYSMTKQVNEFTELRTRQWNYTNKYKVPKTAKNKKIFNFLSYPGNTSEIAYQRVEGAQMYMNGVPIIMDGYAMVQDSDSDYNIVIYEGAVTFFEAIKELTLQNLDYSDLDHNYGENTMENSFANTSGYIYPTAQSSPAQPLTQHWFDAPNPSIFVKDVVRKISEISGIEIEGTLLADPLYDKAVITTEKGIRLSQDSVTLEDSDSLGRFIDTQSSYTEPNPPTVTVPQGFYKIVLDYSVYGDSQPSIEFNVDSTSTDGIVLTEETGTKEWYVYGSQFDAVMSANNPNGINTTVTLNLQAFKINYGTVPVVFSELVHNMQLKDFLKELITLWGVNIYPNIKETKVRLDFINDIDTSDVVDLSRYLQGGDPEIYKFGGYTSKNQFTYAVDEDQEKNAEAYLFYSHNEGESSVHFTSRFKQPVKLSLTRYQNYLFDSDMKPKDGDIKIFYIERPTGTISLSTVGGIKGKSVTGYARYEFEDLKFENLLPRYYYFLQSRVFRQPVKLKRTFALPIVLFYNLDLQKRYYLQQEASTFIINKITMNSRGLTEAELIKVDKKRLTGTVPVAIITGTTFFSEAGDKTVSLSGSESYSSGGYIESYYWELFDGSTLLEDSDKNDFVFNLPEGATYEVCLTVTNEQAITNKKCENVTSRPPVVNEPDFFTDETLLLSNACYTLLQVKVNGNSNETVSINVKSGIINGKSNLVFWDASASIGSNCQITGCPLLGQIVLPRLGPGVNEINYNDNEDIDLTLDVNGEGWMQFRVEGVKDVSAPVDNGTFITIKDNDSGFTRTIIQRYWAKTYQCDSF